MKLAIPNRLTKEQLVNTVLTLHSLARWLVVASGLLTLALAVTGWVGRRGWSKRDETLSIVWVSLVDLQTLIGLLLYFVWSPFRAMIFDHFKDAMKIPVARFFGMEHGFAMLVALVVAHVGRVRSKKYETSDYRRHRVMAIASGIYLLIVLAMMPWPWLEYGRPLVRMFN
ncbi:MAG: hypothetical protein NVS3B20_04420 [Polyangiales bacterium]